MSSAEKFQFIIDSLNNHSGEMEMWVVEDQVRTGDNQAHFTLQVDGKIFEVQVKEV